MATVVPLEQALFAVRYSGCTARLRLGRTELVIQKGEDGLVALAYVDRWIQELMFKDLPSDGWVINN